MANSKGVAAKGGGNRTNSSLSRKLGLPPSHKNTYGVGDGKGGGTSAAKGGGNQTNPALAGKLGLPPSHPNYDSKT